MNYSDLATSVANATKELPLLVKLLIAAIFIALLFWVVKNVVKFILTLFGFTKKTESEKVQI